MYCMHPVITTSTVLSQTFTATVMSDVPSFTTAPVNHQIVPKGPMATFVPKGLFKREERLWSPTPLAQIACPLGVVEISWR